MQNQRTFLEKISTILFIINIYVLIYLYKSVEIKILYIYDRIIDQ